MMLDKIDTTRSLNENTTKHAFVESANRLGLDFMIISPSDITIDNNVMNISNIPLTPTDIIWNQSSPTGVRFDNAMMALSLATDKFGNPVRMLNRPEDILMFNGKRLPSFLGTKLHRHVVCLSIDSATNTINSMYKYEQPIVVKCLFSFGGRGVNICTSIKEAIAAAESIIKQSGIVKIEDFVDTSGDRSIDKRVYVADGKIVFHVDRVNTKGKLCNLSAGGIPKHSQISERQMKSINKIIAFMKLRNIFYAGIDFIGDSNTEINLTSPGGINGYISLGNDNPCDKIILSAMTHSS